MYKCVCITQIKTESDQKHIFIFLIWELESLPKKATIIYGFSTGLASKSVSNTLIEASIQNCS
jgi:hypothetical protein